MNPKEMIAKFRDFVNGELRNPGYEGLAAGKFFFVKQLRIFFLAFRKSGEDDIRLRASSVTFLSRLSVVPLAALGFGIAKGFGFQNYLKDELTKQFGGQEQVLEWVLSFANSLLKNIEKAKGGVIAGVGVAFLLWTIIRVFGNIEDSFNAIWQVRKGRNWIRKFADYISLMLLAPVLFVIQSTTMVYVTYQIHSAARSVELFGYIAPVAMFAIKLAPLVIIWILFAMIYMVMPNTYVKPKAAAIAGIIAGTMFQIVQWAYIRFQVGMSVQNAVYGSFAALPLFLIWLNWSWMIVLLGTEICHINQNADHHALFSKRSEPSPKNKNLIALLITHFVVRDFAQGHKAPKASEIADKLEIPVSLTSETLKQLTDCGVLAKVVGDDTSVHAYQPARDIDAITIRFVAEMMENHGRHTLIPPSETYREIGQCWDSLASAVRNMPENKLLKDI